MVAAGYSVFYFTLCRMDTLAFGALLAVLAREYGGLETVRGWMRGKLTWCVLALVPCYFIFTGSRNASIQVFKYTVIAALFSGLLAFVLTTPPGSPVSKVLSGKVTASVANIVMLCTSFTRPSSDWSRPECQPHPSRWHSPHPSPRHYALPGAAGTSSNTHSYG